MAKDDKAVETTDAPPKKSKKLIVIIAVVVVLLLAIVAGAMMLLNKGDHEDDEEVAAEQEKTKKKDKKKDATAAPVFFPLEPFTVNLLPENGEQYLQVALSLELEDATSDPELKSRLPKIRNNIMLLLSSKKATELLTKEGKEALAEGLLDEINTVINPPRKNKKGELIPPDGPVKTVLFTTFIIQ